MKKTWTGWGPAADQPQQHYLVEPRHLGGGGDLRFVAEYLRASGWKDISRTGGPIVFDSPDHSVRVGFDPTSMPGGWTISGKAVGQQPAWHATFTTAVPIEIVAGFTDTLTKPRSAHAPNVWAPLEQNAWETSRVEEKQQDPEQKLVHFVAVAPDRNAWLQYHQDGLSQGHWWAGARTEHGRAWDAVFTSTTPLHLVQEFSAALSDPTPVLRPRGNVPATKWIRTTSVSVRPSELGAWQQARITAARAATWARNSWSAARPRQRTPSSPHTTAGTKARR
ncbi:DUF317 domain-containing protein [Streptomyces sp. NPDC001553]|uniref:DUF317 domain-containing protein n=1 Tax=Streptomyces sp. NPDC001553 TaxID=3154385 RepID=UPI00332A131A